MTIFNKSTTNLILVLLTVATVALTFMGIVDAKDFIGIVLMVLSYKFGRGQVTQTA